MTKSVLTPLIIAALFFAPCPMAFSFAANDTRAAVGEYVLADAGGPHGDVRGALPGNPLLGRTWITSVFGEEEQADDEPMLRAGRELTDEEQGIVDAIRKSLMASAKSGGSDLPVVLNDAVDLYIRYFTGTGRKVYARWLDRAERYVPTIKAILRKNGLPEDLAYVAMIESGFNMKARSPAHARGPWQFIHETGRRYGLKVNYWVDERCNLEKSTVAAARYLKDLFDRFGCWYLAAAGYNAGEHRVERAIERLDTKDFWKLRAYKTLPRETQEYVPQLIAAATIARDPEKYGFVGTETACVSRLVKVAVPGGTSLARVARALSMDVDELLALNPEIMRGITPPGRGEYQITLPGTPDDEAMKKTLEAEMAKGGQLVDIIKHRVKRKEHLAGIMKQYDVTHADLMLLNEGRKGIRLTRGRVLYIPKFAPAKGEQQAPGALAENRGAQKVIAMADEEAEVTTLRRTGKKRTSSWARPRLAKHVVHKAARHNDKTKKAGLSSSRSERDARRRPLKRRRRAYAILRRNLPDLRSSPHKPDTESRPAPRRFLPARRFFSHCLLNPAQA
jgi:membrane-bound lytic murein transglycosylase D